MTPAQFQLAKPTPPIEVECLKNVKTHPDVGCIEGVF